MPSCAEKLKEKLEILNHYNRVLTLLDWDMYTAAPKNGYQGMADSLSYFYQKHFELSTSDEFYELLCEAKEPAVYDTLDEGMQYTVRTLHRDLTRERRVPKEFVARFIEAQSRSRKAWEEARTADDFSMYEPHLQAMIDLTQEKCGYTDPGENVYDVLLDQYEEGIHAGIIDRVFGELKEGLKPLIETILEKEKDHPLSPIYSRTWPVHRQKEVQNLLLEYIGYDFDSGTTGQSMHPFTLSFSRNDVRVTNRFHEDTPIPSMFTSIHEGGHAIFDQNVDPALMGTEAASCKYMGVHESQSRFFENILGRRRSFWIPIYPKVQELLPGLKDISLDEFVREINHVYPSFIRTEADEVTYCLHIILRYEMEQEIFRKGTKAKDLPQIWNAKMQQLLGITPEKDSDGILQDMHWSDGGFGYFPSYLLGSIYDGMYLDAITAELGDVDRILERGGIKEITHWLNEKIHRYGGLRLPAQVIENVCHRELSAEPLLRYFRSKYE